MPGRSRARAEAEVGQELLRGRVEQRPARALPAPGRPNPARIHQHVERALGDLHAADRLDLGAADRLMIGDDRQRLGRRARQAPRLLARSAKQMREVGRGLEMPAPAALDELDPAALVMRGELRRARSRSRPRRHARRSRRRSAARRTRTRSLRRRAASSSITRPCSLIGANGSSCAMSSRPRRASSSAARKLDASAERRNCGSSVVGQEAFEQGPVERRADHLADPLDRFLERHHRRARGRRASPAGSAP